MVWQRIKLWQMASGGVTASCTVAFSIVVLCTERLVPWLCRPKDGSLYTLSIMVAMINAEPAPMSSTRTEPAGAATGEDAGHVSMAVAAHDSPGSPLAQAEGDAPSADGPGQRSSWAEAAQPGSAARESGSLAAAGSAGVAHKAGIDGAAEGLSLAGRLSAFGMSTGDMEADGSLLVASSASTAVAEHSTARGAPLYSDVWDAADGVGGKEQTCSSESSPAMPCSATAAGTAAAADSKGLSLPETVFLPPATAAAHKDAPASEESCEGSEGAATASGGSVESSQAARGEPLTPQQHAVVAALMVVMKRAKLEGHEAFAIAREWLLCNDWHTQAVLQYNRAGQELHSISNMEQMLQIGDQDDRDVLDALATQYTAAGLQPLQVFTRSVQCGVMSACRAAESRGEAAVLARHQQVAELHRQLDKHRLTAGWMRSNVDLLVRQGVDEIMAELIMHALVLLAELCKRCSWRPLTGMRWNASLDYVALDHLLPGG